MNDEVSRMSIKHKQRSEKITFTFRMDKNMNEIVEYLQSRTRLSKTAVITLALSTYYNHELLRESKMIETINHEKC